MRQGTLAENDPRLPEIIERLKAGASLIEESKALGYSHNGVLRAALRKHLGGVVQYDAMMSERTKPKKAKGCSPVPEASQ